MDCSTSHCDTSMHCGTTSHHDTSTYHTPTTDHTQYIWSSELYLSSSYAPEPYSSSPSIYTRLSSSSYGGSKRKPKSRQPDAKPGTAISSVRRVATPRVSAPTTTIARTLPATQLRTTRTITAPTTSLRHQDLESMLTEPPFADSFTNPPITEAHLFNHTYGHLWGMTMASELATSSLRICPHRCASDPAFFRSVRQPLPNPLFTRDVISFFPWWSRSKSRVWKCKKRNCYARAWVEMDRDTGDVTLQICRD